MFHSQNCRHGMKESNAIEEVVSNEQEDNFIYHFSKKLRLMEIAQVVKPKWQSKIVIYFSTNTNQITCANTRATLFSTLR